MRKGNGKEFFFFVIFTGVLNICGGLVAGTMGVWTLGGKLLRSQS